MDELMSADGLAAAIAARTTHDGPRPPRLPREPWEVERAILETRAEVDRQIAERPHLIDGGHMRLRAGQKAGRGRKVCPHCDVVCFASARKCQGCRRPFRRASRR